MQGQGSIDATAIVFPRICGLAAKVFSHKRFVVYSTLLVQLRINKSLVLNVPKFRGSRRKGRGYANIIEMIHLSYIEVL